LEYSMILSRFPDRASLVWKGLTRLIFQIQFMIRFIAQLQTFNMKL